MVGRRGWASHFRVPDMSTGVGERAGTTLTTMLGVARATFISVQARHCDTPLRTAYVTCSRRAGTLTTFFAAISFITSISRSRSATSFFRRAFSCSSCFSRRTSSGWNVPNRFFHVYSVWPLTL